jgi:xanthine dehydrogenase YagR molybdenum-binding subunit
VRIEERNVYINAGPSSPMRAPGWVQGMFALELAMDDLARKLKLDRLEFRRRNNINRVRAAEFELGAQRFGWAEKSAAAKSLGGRSGHLRRGIAVASCAWHSLGGSGPEAIAVARRDGRFEVRVGTQDIGTGTRTVLAMVAAEELGMPLGAVTAQIGDTRFPFSVPSGGSSTSPSDSPAIRQAAAHLKQKLFRIAAPMLGAEPDDLEARDATIRVRFEPTRAVAMAEVCRRIPGDSISAEGERVPNYQGFRNDQAGCQFAEVEVDIETGVVRVLKVVAVHDSGLILDPLTARSQVNGGVIMGVGFALFEDRRLDPQTRAAAGREKLRVRRLQRGLQGFALELDGGKNLAGPLEHGYGQGGIPLRRDELGGVVGRQLVEEEEVGHLSHIAQRRNALLNQRGDLDHLAALNFKPGRARVG